MGEEKWKDPWENPVNVTLPNGAEVSLIRCPNCKRPRFIGYTCEGCRAEESSSELDRRAARIAELEGQLDRAYRDLGQRTEALVLTEVALCEAKEALRGILEDDSRFVSLDDQRKRWSSRMVAAEAALSSSPPCAHESRAKELENSGSPWPTVDVLDKLSAFAQMMLRDRDYTGDGWESVHAAAQEAKVIVGIFRRASGEKGGEG